MSERSRKISIVLLAIALALVVYAPLLPAGFFGGDFSLLVRISELDGSVQDYFSVAGTDGRPLAALSLAGSEALWARHGAVDGVVWSEFGAAWLRLENLLLLFVTAIGLRAVLVRALEPFLGAEQARSASVTAALFLFLHPLGVSTVAQVAGRGELLAAALGSWGMLRFLRARQTREPRIMGSAVLLVLLAAFAGRIAYFLPPLVALLEFLSARRYRPKWARLRTALLAGVISFGVVAVEWVARSRMAPDTLLPRLDLLPELGGWALALEKLGVLLLPVDHFGIGIAGYALAVVALLLALHPGFVAARSAPRLWGRILLGWAAALLLVELASLGRRVEPGSLAGAEVLFPATFVMAVGSAIAATAIQGLRRTLIPALVCIAFGLLGRGNAYPYEAAADRIADLRRGLVNVAAGENWAGGFFVLDPPLLVEGELALQGSMEPMLNPMFQFESPDRGRRFPWVSGGSAQALAMFSGQPEFRRQSSNGLMVLGVRDPGEASGAPGWGGLDGGVKVEPFRTVTQDLIWSGKAGENTLQVDPMAYRSLVMRVPGEWAAEHGPPLIRWRGAVAPDSQHEVFGLWKKGPDGTREAHFDLSKDLAWLLGGTVNALWLPGILGQEIEIQMGRGPRSLPPEVVPRRVHGDWVFDVSQWQATPGTDWYLEILDLSSMAHREFHLGEAVRGRLRAGGIAEWVEGLLVSDLGPLVWRLEVRREGVPLARAQGRRELGG
ncbi:MAG: hypothetical protein P1V35_05745 [Planctomycetota bacterium]|nr:hypothetical protein [Planctomycetota bacterium]